MTLFIAWAALRRHPFSVLCTLVLAVCTGSLLGTSTPAALLLWATGSLLSLEVWHALEPLLLRRIGCRQPSHLERDRLGQVLGCTPVDVLVYDAPQPWLGAGLRSLVVSRGLLELLEDPPLGGLLGQATAQLRSATLAGELIVWLGNLPLLGAWWLSRWLAQLGHVLAIVVGGSLVLPLLLWPHGFVRWVGRLFGLVFVGVLGSALLSSGLAAHGLVLLLAWALVPGLQALLAWERRRAESVADQATVEAGHGAQLLEALELLACAEPIPPPDGLLGLLRQPGTRVATRADRVARAI